jgi:hypothetical protein
MVLMSSGHMPRGSSKLRVMMLFGDKTFSKLTTPERSPELDLVGVLETICLWIFPGASRACDVG